MYYIYLDLLLQIHKMLQSVSCGIYVHDKKANRFVSIPSFKRSIKWTHFSLRIYLLLLLLSLIFGVRQYTILENVLSVGFVASRLGTYSLFLIVAEGDVLKDAIVLLNRMLSYENGILCSHKPSKPCALKLHS